LFLRAGIPIAEGHGGGKPISFAYHGFHKTRLLWVVPQRGTDFTDSGIYAVINIEENVLAPEPLGDLLAGNQLAGPLEQQDEQLHREFLQPQLTLAPLQPVAGLIERELAEMELLGRKSPTQAPELRGRNNASEAPKKQIINNLEVHQNFIPALPRLHCPQ
jgi:hypothetical protein